MSRCTIEQARAHVRAMSRGDLEKLALDVFESIYGERDGEKNIYHDEIEYRSCCDVVEWISFSIDDVGLRPCMLRRKRPTDSAGLSPTTTPVPVRVLELKPDEAAILLGFESEDGEDAWVFQCFWQDRSGYYVVGIDRLYYCTVGNQSVVFETEDAVREWLYQAAEVTA